MRKKVLSIILVVLLVCTTGCGVPVDVLRDGNETSMFVLVEESDYWRVVYHKETKVMYSASRGDSRGIFTVLVNPDGSPMIWEGK